MYDHPLVPRPAAAPHRTARSTAFRRAVAVAAVISSGLAGCASAPTLDAQWSDPQLSGSFLRGARVFVACDAYEVVVRQLCQDGLGNEVVARGGTPVFPGPETNVAADRSLDGQLLPAARQADAKALMVMTIAASSTDVSPGFSIGIGGFGFGGHSAGGVGVAAPVGGGRVSTGYSANGRITDVSSGRLVWTAKASAPPSDNLSAQVTDLSKTVFGAADKAGLF